MSGEKQPDSQESSTFDKELAKDFIEIQNKQITLEKEKLGLQQQHLASQTELARLSLSIQEKLLLKDPDEKRKSRAQLFRYGIVILLIFLIFFSYCLYFDHEKFLLYFLGALSHLLTLLIGYYFGNKRKMTRDEQDSPIFDDAEIVSED